MTRYAYDPRTFRLARLRSERVHATGRRRTIPARGAGAPGPRLRLRPGRQRPGVVDRTPGSGVARQPGRRRGRRPGCGALVAPATRWSATSATTRSTGWSPPPAGSAPTRPAGRRGRTTRVASAAPRMAPRTRTTPRPDARLPGDVRPRRGRQRSSGCGTPAAERAFTRRVRARDGTNRLRRVASATHDVRRTPFDRHGNLVRRDARRHFDWDHADRLRCSASRPARRAVGARPVPLRRRRPAGEEAGPPAGRRVETHLRRGTSSSTTAGGQARRRGTTTVTSWTTSAHLASSGWGRRIRDDRGRRCSTPGRPPRQRRPSRTTGAFVNREEFTPYGETSSAGSPASATGSSAGTRRGERAGCHGRALPGALARRWMSCDPRGPARPAASTRSPAATRCALRIPYGAKG